MNKLLLVILFENLCFGKCRSPWEGILGGGGYAYADCVYTAKNASYWLDVKSASFLILLNHRFAGVQSTIVCGIKTLSSVTMIGCVFEDIVANSKGGGCIYLISSATSDLPTCTVISCTFRRCTCDFGEGGAIHLENILPAISSSGFYSCSSTEDGGAIFVTLDRISSPAQVTSVSSYINNCIFVENRAMSVRSNGGGGSVLIQNPHDTSFAHNRMCGGVVGSSGKGTDVYVGWSDVYVGHAATIDFSSSCSNSEGCRVYDVSVDGCLINGTFTECTSEEDGKACDFCTECTPSNETSCERNCSEEDAGKLCRTPEWGGMLGRGNYVYSNCVYTAENASSWLNVRSASSLTLLNHRFTDINSSIIYELNSMVSVTLFGCFFENIKPNNPDVGCIHLVSFPTSKPPTCTVISCTFRRCTADKGGAIFLTNVLPAISLSRFYSCSSAEDGGAIFVVLDRTSSALVTSANSYINDCIFVQNKAGNSGLSGNGGSVFIQNPHGTSFAHNRMCGGVVGSEGKGTDVYVGSTEKTNGNLAVVVDYSSSCSNSEECRVYSDDIGDCVVNGTLTECGVEDNQVFCETEPEREPEPEPETEPDEGGKGPSTKGQDKAAAVWIVVGTVVGVIVVVGAALIAFIDTAAKKVSLFLLHRRKQKNASAKDNRAGKETELDDIAAESEEGDSRILYENEADAGSIQE